MGVVTTFVCDLTGYSSHDKAEFVEIEITSRGYYKSNGFGCGGVDAHGYYRYSPYVVRKFVTLEVATKLGLQSPRGITPSDAVEPIFEEQLQALLRPMIEAIAADIVHDKLQEV